MKQTDRITATEMQGRYKRAKALYQASLTTLGLVPPEDTIFYNSSVASHWIGRNNCFWYERSGPKGKEYRLVDAGAATNELAFDHDKLASALAKASGEKVKANHLPFSNLVFTDDTLTFEAFDKQWSYDDESNIEEGMATHPADWLVSPDGKKAIFMRDYNLWLRNLESGEEKALTHDGEKHYAYAVQTENRHLAREITAKPHWGFEQPEAIWSPDSSKIFTVQVDERQVRSLPSMLYVPQDGTVAPRVSERKYALPGDKNIAEYRMLVIDVATAREAQIRYPQVEDSFIWLGPFSGNRAWWSGDSRTTYFIDMTRGKKTARVIASDVVTGTTRVLFEETSDTFLDLGMDFEQPESLMPLPATNELIWYSERTGWAHLYLYDLTTGEQKNVITQGEWLVREVLAFDAVHRDVFIRLAGRVAGRNPYYQEVARVNIDTGAMTLLATGDCNYAIGKLPHSAMTGAAGVSPTGDYIVATRTRADAAPVTELRNRNGELVLEVETADISGLPANWRWPEPVKLIAADGKTDIYGVVFRPSDFDPNKKYPVLDCAQTNPFYGGVETNGLGIFALIAQPLAELGFIVVSIEGRGRGYRSKAFHDHAYRDASKGSDMADHVAGIKQLAERYSYMDIERVGLINHDGDNGVIYGLLQYPEFYKVGATSSLWDARLLKQGEVYHGLIDEAGGSELSLGNMAERLQGKLLIVIGMKDAFFHMGGVFQLVEALIKADKDFDMVMLPNGEHMMAFMSENDQYGRRRMWDYLVEHLLGETPPKEFRIEAPNYFNGG